MHTNKYCYSNRAVFKQARSTTHWFQSCKCTPSTSIKRWPKRKTIASIPPPSKRNKQDHFYPQPLTVHNLTFTTSELELLSKGLCFAPTPKASPTTKRYTQILCSYDTFARSLIQKFVHAQYHSHIHWQKEHHCTTANIYRRMKLLPPHPLWRQQFSVTQKVEHYIESSKNELTIYHR